MRENIQRSSPAPGVGLLLIDAPPYNFGSLTVFERLHEGLTRFRDDGVRVVIIGSAVPGYFMAHGSLDGIVETLTGNPTGKPRAMNLCLRELDTGPMVSIAAIDGQAWGGGAETAWACDLRVASEAATLGQPEVLLGTTPGWGGVAKLRRIAGEAACLRLVLDGRPVDAQEALRLGLVHRVVAAGEAIAAATRWGEWLAKRPEWALQECKSLIKRSRDLPLREALAMELETFVKNASRTETIDLMRAAIRRYDEGSNSYDAIGLPRE